VKPRAPGATVRKPDVAPLLTCVPTDAQVDALRTLLRAVPHRYLLAVAPSYKSPSVWCEVRDGARGMVTRADYTREEVEALGDDWAADAAGRLTP
jgi:hypothetical protein